MSEKPLPPLPEDVPEDRLVRLGGPIDAVVVSLRVFGGDLDPQEITNLLGCEPTSARRKGDIIPNLRYHRVASTGSWLLDSKSDKRVELEQQVEALLRLVTNSVAVWRDLTGRYQVDIFCGLFLENINRGFGLSPNVMRYLAERNISIGFDIYLP